MYNNYVDLFDNLFDMFAMSNRVNSISSIPTDIIEKADSYIVKMDIPGVKKEQLTISFKDGYLTVKVKNNKKDDKGRIILNERNSKDMARSIYIDNKLTKKDINASVEDGILTIAINKINKKRAIKEKMSQTLD